MTTWMALTALLLTASPARVAAPAAAAGPSFLDEPPATTVAQAPRWPQALGMATVIGAVTVGGIMAMARAQRRRGQLAPSEAIHLRAVRSLGGKQRIALVEVGGERLLLSTNDREVTLLTHLPQEHVAEVAASEHTHASAAVNAEAPPMAPTVAAVEAALEQDARGEQQASSYAQTPFTADLAGLRQWQERAAQERRA